MAAKNKFMNAMKMPAIADMFSSEADRQRESGDLVTEVPLSELHPFVNHPFEVRDDEDMQKLVDSIKENGVLTNLTVRPRAEGGYEIISGHRRFHAAQLAGLDKIKVQVRDVDDDQAIIDMVDANIQREHISPMEKARAYAMKLEAISHQGERRQETSNQVGWKLESAHEVGQQAGDPEREQMPSLHDFYNNLSLQGSQAKALTMALSMYVDGTMDLFAHQTNVDLQNHCICFNTVKLGKSMQSIGMMTVLDQIWNRITRNRVLGRRTWIFTDEFQLLLGNSACTNYYFELSSRARKWGAILTSITQHVRSVLNNEDARRMLSDCGYIKLLNQAPDDANDIARLLHISDEEKRYIENAEVGSGLLIADKVVVPFNNTFPQDTELFRLMDTNPNRKK